MRQGQERHSENTWREQATPKTATPLHLVKSPANEAAGLVASLARLNALLARINGEKHRQLERLAVLTLQIRND